MKINSCENYGIQIYYSLREQLANGRCMWYTQIHTIFLIYFFDIHKCVTICYMYSQYIRDVAMSRLHTRDASHARQHKRCNTCIEMLRRQDNTQPMHVIATMLLNGVSKTKLTVQYPQGAAVSDKRAVPVAKCMSHVSYMSLLPCIQQQQYCFIENEFNRDWTIGPPIPCARRRVSGGYLTREQCQLPSAPFLERQFLVNH